MLENLIKGFKGKVATASFYVILGIVSAGGDCNGSNECANQYGQSQYGTVITKETYGLNSEEISQMKSYLQSVDSDDDGCRDGCTPIDENCCDCSNE